MPDEIIAVVAILMPVFLVSTIIGVRHRARGREMVHRERMAAIQAGFNLPASRLGTLVVTTFIGAGVPICAMFCAWFADLTSPGSPSDIWTPCMLVAMSGIIAGAVLLYRQLDHRPASPETKSSVDSWTKPYIDPDAYDVVSRRG